ncbi:MAG: hypothetical protein PF487_06695 [Bacteroidales bacterium]|jgi:hypothetical protein|nr:hypothetical protein [Bacteroidales bacterium]
MKKKLYYVIEKQTQDVGDDIHELTGWKTITVYEIINNEPKEFFTIEGKNVNDSEEEIKNYLNDSDENEIELKIL